MFQSMRGDFCRHTQRKKRIGHTETNTVSEKPAVCGLFATFSQVFEITALFGWRRSANRAISGQVACKQGILQGNSQKYRIQGWFRSNQTR
ncbi:hypothetical protein [Afipia broomeae]|uniref:hypothetical protein n=1 Tax=Afipia broomeae TaxID=56946 RepID=UPI00142EF8B7|nr:hypothetical protein [Afipia broomeae]